MKSIRTSASGPGVTKALPDNMTACVTSSYILTLDRIFAEDAMIHLLAWMLSIVIVRDSIA